MENSTPKDRVSINLKVMSGSLNENDDQKGVAHFLEHMLFNGSTHFAPGELVTYFQTIGMQFGADANAYTGFDETVYGVLLPEGDEKNLSQEAYAVSMQRFGQMYTALYRSIDGQMQLSGYRFLAGGDLRFGLPPFESFTTLMLKDVRSWIDTALKNEPLEVSVVGDFDEASMIDIVGTYIGSLPARPGLGGAKRPSSIRFPAVQSSGIQVETEIPQALIVVAYPTEDMWDIKRTRRLAVLGEIFSDRLRERLRESLGATYSPYAYNRPWRAYPGYGVFQAAALVDPAQTTVVVDEVRQIISDLSKNGIRPDELERALGPSLTGIKDRIRTNAYWLDTVLTGSKQFPQQIEWSRTIQTDYADITSRELSQLAAKYLNNDKAAAIVIKPV
jgi:zinc protease